MDRRRTSHPPLKLHQGGEEAGVGPDDPAARTQSLESLSQTKTGVLHLMSQQQGGAATDAGDAVYQRATSASPVQLHRVRRHVEVSVQRRRRDVVDDDAEVVDAADGQVGQRRDVDDAGDAQCADAVDGDGRSAAEQDVVGDGAQLVQYVIGSRCRIGGGPRPALYTRRQVVTLWIAKWAYDFSLRKAITKLV